MALAGNGPAPKPVKAPKGDKVVPIRRAAAPKAEKAPREPKPAKAGQDCTCGCGGVTKGGRFLPGHDARYHAALKREAAAKAAAAE